MCIRDRDYADCIMCVSELTRRTVIEQYHQNPKKVFAMHNAVYPLSQEYQDIPRPDHSKEKIVTFLGRMRSRSTEATALLVVVFPIPISPSATIWYPFRPSIFAVSTPCLLYTSEKFFSSASFRPGSSWVFSVSFSYQPPFDYICKIYL